MNCLPVPLQSDRTPESYSVFSVVAQESRYHTILRDYESNSARALIAETCSGAMPRTKALHRRFAEFRALLILSCLDVHAILWTIYMGSEPYDSKVREQHERTIHGCQISQEARTVPNELVLFNRAVLGRFNLPRPRIGWWTPNEVEPGFNAWPEPFSTVESDRVLYR